MLKASIPPDDTILYLVVVLVIVAFLFLVLALVADMMGRQRRNRRGSPLPLEKRGARKKQAQPEALIANRYEIR